jgi:hypothetical protein
MMRLEASRAFLPLLEASGPIPFLMEPDLVPVFRKAQNGVLPLDQSAAINFVVREWCISMGFLPPPAEDAT